ncbi:MAG TPA: hypothetical protein VKT52_10090 [Ktedonobacterales bacterium]|nr:hypothetical protein [Ktedonobacterales bacterium]
MGKLIEKLRETGQGASAGFGFMSAARSQARAARPAAILVAVGSGDGAVAEAAVKNGADGLLLTGWQPGSDATKIVAAAGTAAVWGVDYEGEGEDAEGVLQAALDAGAAFAVVGPSTPASVLFEELEKLDLVVTVDPPETELERVLLRAENLLPAQAALVRAHLSSADLAKLTVAAFARLKLIFETLRFPALVTLKDVPAPAHVRALVRMGADALVLPGAGASAEVLGKQVAALRAELEKTPARRDEGGSVVIGGLMQAGGQSLAPGKPEPKPEPEPEPEKEP